MRILARLVALAAVAATAGCAAPANRNSQQQEAGCCGIVVQGLHLSAHGYMLDLRYRVTDPGKAAPLLDAHKKVQLLDDVRQARLGVPASPVIGAMRQTSRNHVVYTDRDYFILFVNPGRAVKAGDTLQLAVDGQRIASLTVR
jgi:hypothetical protein